MSSFSRYKGIAAAANYLSQALEGDRVRAQEHAYAMQRQAPQPGDDDQNYMNYAKGIADRRLQLLEFYNKQFSDTRGDTNAWLALGEEGRKTAQDEYEATINSINRQAQQFGTRSYYDSWRNNEEGFLPFFDPTRRFDQRGPVGQNITWNNELRVDENGNPILNQTPRLGEGGGGGGGGGGPTTQEPAGQIGDDQLSALVGGEGIGGGDQRPTRPAVPVPIMREETQGGGGQGPTRPAVPVPIVGEETQIGEPGSAPRRRPMVPVPITRRQGTEQAPVMPITQEATTSTTSQAPGPDSVEQLPRASEDMGLTEERRGYQNEIPQKDMARTMAQLAQKDVEEWDENYWNLLITALKQGEQLSVFQFRSRTSDGQAKLERIINHYRPNR